MNNILRQKENVGSTKLIMNSILNGIGWCIPIMITLFTIPFYINTLSEEGYGVWVLIGTITGYFSLVQIGIGPAIIKYISEYNRKQSFQSISDLINASLLFTFIVGIITGVIIFYLSPNIIKIINVSDELYKDSVISLQYGGLFFVILLISNVFIAIYSGFQRYDLANCITIIRVSLFAVISCILLSNGCGLIGLVFSNVISNILVVLFGSVLIKKVLPSYKVKYTNIIPSLKKIFGFSIYTFISQVASLLNSRLPEFLIGVLLGPSQVTYFNISTKLVGVFASGSSTISSVLFPYVSELHVNDEQETIKKIQLKSTKYFSILIFPIYIIFIFYSKTILSMWISSEIAQSSYVIMSLYSLAYLISGMTIIPTQILLGFGKVKKIAVFSIMIVLIALVFYFPMINLFGLVGSGYTIVISQIVGVYFVYYSNKILKINFLEYLDILKLPIAMSIISFFPVLYFCNIYHFPFSIKYINIFPVIISVILYISLFFLQPDVRKSFANNFICFSMNNKTRS